MGKLDRERKARILTTALADLDLARLQWMFVQAFAASELDFSELDFNDHEEWAKGMIHLLATARNLLAKDSGEPGEQCCYCPEELYGVDHYYLHLVHHHSDEPRVQARLDGLVAVAQEHRLGG